VKHEESLKKPHLLEWGFLTLLKRLNSNRFQQAFRIIGIMLILEILKS